MHDMLLNLPRMKIEGKICEKEPNFFFISVIFEYKIYSMITSSHNFNVCHFCCACNLERVTMSKILLKMMCKFHNLKHLKKLLDSNLNVYESLILICNTLIPQFIITTICMLK